MAMYLGSNKVEIGQSGGGSSDFSTATVTIINNSGQNFVAACPNLYDDRMYITVDSADMGADFPFEVVLYKGEGNLALPKETSLTLTATGDISASSSGRAAIITGDGTITIS